MRMARAIYSAMPKTLGNAEEKLLMIIILNTSGQLGKNST